MNSHSFEPPKQESSSLQQEMKALREEIKSLKNKNDILSTELAAIRTTQKKISGFQKKIMAGTQSIHLQLYLLSQQQNALFQQQIEFQEKATHNINMLWAVIQSQAKERTSTNHLQVPAHNPWLPPRHPHPSRQVLANHAVQTSHPSTEKPSEKHKNLTIRVPITQYDISFLASASPENKEKSVSIAIPGALFDPDKISPLSLPPAATPVTRETQAFLTAAGRDPGGPETEIEDRQAPKLT